MTTVLAHCPFCRSGAEYDESAGFVQCISGDCGATGPFASDEAEATQLWNAVASPSPVSALREALEKAEGALREAADKFWVIHLNHPGGYGIDEHLTLYRHREEDKALLGRKADEMTLAANAARSVLSSLPTEAGSLDLEKSQGEPDAARDALYNVIHQLWCVLDDSCESATTGEITVEPEGFKKLGEAMDALEALVPESEGPFWGGYPVTYLWPASPPTAPASKGAARDDLAERIDAFLGAERNELALEAKALLREAAGQIFFLSATPPSAAEIRREERERCATRLRQEARNMREQAARWPVNHKTARLWLDRSTIVERMAETVDDLGDSSALPQDVARLVVAARMVAFYHPADLVNLHGDDEDRAAIRELDAASEAFSSRVAWDDDPNDEEDAIRSLPDQDAPAGEGGR